MIPPEPIPDPRVPPASPRPGGGAALAELNEAQARAVTHGGGPLLVLAGAGSGKTRVITHRIAHLVLSSGVQPSRIVAVTFTNKAADEMRQRVSNLLGYQGVLGWIGTFHALCLRILRRDGTRIGLDPGFNVYDTDDQLAMVKRILREEASSAEVGTPRSYLSRISRAKNALETPATMERRAHTPEARLTAGVYRRYEEGLRRSNAADFDDLLVRTLELFQEHSEVAQGYASRCEHLLVDEYQDTNRPQYLLVRHLTAEHGNVCVVGDEDQSIYRFRGAEIRNILDFEQDYPGTHTVRLERNYRSSGTIIQAASAVIANNRYRKGKTIFTENPRGDQIELFRAPDDRSEAVWLASRVRELEPAVPFEEIAALYRTNAQSRQIEEIFRRDGIPYQVVGSVQFYERKEVKDLLAYLKLVANPSDDVAFRRIVNTPPRGIGNTTLDQVQRVARTHGMTLMGAAAHVVEQGLAGTRPSRKLGEFIKYVSDLALRADDEPVAALIERVLEDLNYDTYLEKAYAGQGSERMENVRALVSAAVEFAEESDETTLRAFLDRSALVSDADEVGGRPGVTLMTVHCAKGLEFPVVFLVGLEENLFPHAMSRGSDEDLEEERRLAYVAMTRAKQRLFLSLATFRRFQGALLPNPPSRFIDEIPAELIREVAGPDAGFFGDWGGHEVRETAGGSGAHGSSAARVAARVRRQQPIAPKLTPGPDPGDGFAVGAFVRHPRFGDGQILQREGAGKALKLTIHFLQHGPKKILPAYTRLQVEVR